MDQVKLRPPLTFPVSCEYCDRTEQASFWPIVRDYKFSFGPIKIVVIESDGQIMEWHLLCSDCLLVFDEQLAKKHSDSIRRYTLQGHDRTRLADFLQKKPNVMITRGEPLI